jgi:hypothetical protein
MTPTQTHFDLLDAFAKDGCSVCRLTIAAVETYIDGINYEAVIDPTLRAELDPAWGFCNLHAQHWVERAHPLGTALIYENVLGRIERELARAQPIRGGVLAGIGSRLGSKACTLLRPWGQCSICRERDREEHLITAALATGLATDPAFCEAYGHSNGVCLPHLRMALCHAKDKRAFELLRKHALVDHRRIREQLQEIKRKRDYRFSDEPVGEERGATERAIQRVAGAPGISDR